jgi:hypothetical protein
MAGLGKGTVNKSVIKIVRNMYSNNRCRIELRSHLSEEFCNTKSLLQGCLMSPTLFKIYIDTALEEWSRKCKGMGLNFEGTCSVYNLLFAGDPSCNY